MGEVLPPLDVLLAACSLSVASLLRQVCDRIHELVFERARELMTESGDDQQFCFRNGARRRAARVDWDERVRIAVDHQGRMLYMRERGGAIRRRPNRLQLPVQAGRPITAVCPVP